MQPIEVTQLDLQIAVRTLALTGQAVCVHSSLRSFGQVDGGARTVVQAFLDEGCTLLTPTFSYDYAIAPPLHLRPPRNGWDYDFHYGPRAEEGVIYTPAATDIDPDMGAIPAAVLSFPEHVRGDHPLNSFSAVGPLAERLIAGQKPLDVYAPLQALVDLRGYVLMMGVGLDTMTLLHLAERKAGRELFRRWAYDRAGQAQMVQAGSCSDGFEQLAPILQPWQREIVVGKSVWHCYAAAQTLEAAAAAIRANPQITHCDSPECERCRDAMLGGPILK
jgi:aminoglycoside 3-N-acetyltransferase